MSDNDEPNKEETGQHEHTNEPISSSDDIKPDDIKDTVTSQKTAAHQNIVEQNNDFRGRLNAKTIQIINHQVNTSERTYSVKDFNFAMAKKISSDELLQQAKEYQEIHGEKNINGEYGEPPGTSASLKILHEYHIIVIDGDADFDRHIFSLFLIFSLHRNEDNLDVLHIPPLTENTRIDIASLIEEHKEFCGSKVLLFRDALALRNADIFNFIETINPAFFDKLKEHKSYLVLTVEALALEKIKNHLESVGIYDRTPVPNINALKRGLEFLLKQRNLKALSEEQQLEIAKHARSISRLVLFVNNYLEQIENELLTIEEAFQYIDNLPRWFLIKLPENFDAWFFTFVATLGQCMPDWGGVPWAVFDELRKTLLESVRNWVGHARLSDRYYRKERITDDSLLEKANCQIEPDVFTGRDMLRFEKPEYADKLWAILLKHNRGILLNSVLPALIHLTEYSPQISTRIQAARIIGRIGEIDCYSIMSPCLECWAMSEDPWLNEIFGYSFQGVHSSQNRNYWQLCLSILEQYANSDQKQYERAAIAAYRQIAMLDLKYAMKKLKGIANAKLADNLITWKDILRQRRSQHNNLQSAINNQQSDLVEVYLLAFSHELLNDWAQQLFKNQSETLYQLQYTLTMLCILRGPICIFEELDTWLEIDTQEGLCAVVVLTLLLPHDGIAWQIGKYPILDSETDDQGSFSKLMINALTEDDAPKKMAAFLEKIYMALEKKFPLDLKIYLKDWFFYYLFIWLKDAFGNLKSQKALEDLFVHLLTSENDKLTQQMLEKIKSPPSAISFKNHTLVLQEFQKSVRRRSL